MTEATQKPKAGALIMAARLNDPEMVRDLLQRGADVNERDVYGNTALIFAAPLGYVDVVRLLVNNNANIDIQNKWGSTAETGARNWQRAEILQILQEVRRARECAERQWQLNKKAVKSRINIKKHGI